MTICSAFGVLPARGGGGGGGGGDRLTFNACKAYAEELWLLLLLSKIDSGPDPRLVVATVLLELCPRHDCIIMKSLKSERWFQHNVRTMMLYHPAAVHLLVRPVLAI